MAHPKENKKFLDLLEKASQEDNLFKDSGPPLGSNPFIENEKSFSVEETSFESSETSKLKATMALINILNAQCSFKEFMHQILCIFKEAVKSERASMLELDYVNKDIFFRTVCNMSSIALLSVRIPFGEGVAGFVGAHQVPLVLSNVDESAMYLASVQKLVGFEAKNLIAFPIVIRGQTFGIVELFNRQDESKFTKSDQDTLTELAACAAQVIENRLLMSALSRAVDPTEDAVAA